MNNSLGFRTPRTYSDRPRVWIEPLERRRLLSVTVENGVAVIRGTDQPDDFHVIMPTVPGEVVVAYGVHNGTIGYTWNGRGITGLRIEAGAGNDRVRVEIRGASVPMTVLGGAGNDTINGGSAADYLDGEAGNDLVNGQPGIDTLPDDPWDPTARDPDVVYDRFDRPIGTAKVVDGVLHVTTGDGDQGVAIIDNDDEHFGDIGVWIDGEDVYFNRADVRGISLETGAGDDMVLVRSFGNPVTIPMTISGGDGDDRLYGLFYHSDVPHDLQPFGPEEVGPITLLGGDGDDLLVGGSGRSVLDGGAGADRFESHALDTTIIDPAEPTPPPAREPDPEPTPSDPEPPVPTDSDPSPAIVAPTAPATAQPTASAPAVYDDSTPWLGKADDDLFAQ